MSASTKSLSWPKRKTTTPKRKAPAQATPRYTVQQGKEIALDKRAMIAERTREALHAKRVPEVEAAIAALDHLPSREVHELLKAQGISVSASTIQRRRRVS